MADLPIPGTDAVPACRPTTAPADRGSSPVELAIVTIGVLFLLFASIQIAAVFIARSAALSAAQEAVSAQRAYQAPPGAGAAKADTFLDHTGEWLTGATVAAAPAEAGDGEAEALPIAA